MSAGLMPWISGAASAALLIAAAAIAVEERGRGFQEASFKVEGGIL